MFCNSCMTEIKQADVVFCSQCQVPLHKDCANHCMECGAVMCDTCYGSNNYKCEKCFSPVESFKVIRRSYLEQYESCPYSLYLQLVKGIQPPNGDYAENGIILHQIMDMISNDLLTLEQAIAKYEEECSKALGENEKYEDFRTTGLKVLNTFWSYKPLFVSDKFETEKNIIFSLDDKLPSVSCTLDRIDFIGDDIHIADWKTGKPMAGKKLITDLQPPLYIEAIHKEYGKYPKSFTLYYVAHDKIKKYEMTEEGVYVVNTGRNSYELNINEALERTKIILAKINNHQFNAPQGSNDWYCKNMCWFYSSGICASTTKEQWKILSDKYRKEE